VSSTFSTKKVVVPALFLDQKRPIRKRGIMKIHKHYPSWMILIVLVAGAVGCALISARSVRQFSLADIEISEASGWLPAASCLESLYPQ
jgi:hypothetical protein